MEANAEFQRRNLRGVPSFVIGDDVIVGLNTQRILELVDHRLVTCTQCHARLRVPVKKGSIEVTCPKCHNKFSTTT